MISPDLIDALTPVVEAFEMLGVSYQVGGSAASSVLGKPRSTLDVDVIANLHIEQVDRLVQLLGEDYYASEEMMRDAIRRRGSFNLVHQPTMFKVDVFIAKEGEFDRLTFSRHRPDTLGEEPGARLFNIALPEDVVLRKLEWFHAGGGTSDRQWMDAVNVLQVQAKTLDYDFLWEWANKLGLGDLLKQALIDACLEEE